MLKRFGWPSRLYESSNNQRNQRGLQQSNTIHLVCSTRHPQLWELSNSDTVLLLKARPNSQYFYPLKWVKKRSLRFWRMPAYPDFNCRFNYRFNWELNALRSYGLNRYGYLIRTENDCLSNSATHNDHNWYHSIEVYCPADHHNILEFCARVLVLTYPP